MRRHWQRLCWIQLAAKKKEKYGWKYYVLSENRIPYQRDKTQDDRFFILTLFAIVKELEENPLIQPEDVIQVDLPIGLPPKHYAELCERYESYFKRQGKIHDINYCGSTYHITIGEVMAFPQDYAAMMTMIEKLQQIPKVVGIDIGGFTTDYLLMRKGNPDMEACDSMEKGVITMYNKIISGINSEYDILLEESDIDSILQGNTEFYEEAVVRMTESMVQDFVKDLLNSIRERGIDTKAAYTVFIGGGAKLLSHFLEQSDRLGILIGLVLIGSYTVIKSIFQISIINKIQNYGQLRTIGMTQKQIKKIVKKEGRYLGVRGILIGITLAVLCSAIILAKGINIRNYIVCAMITAAICSIIVSISINKPVKIAMKASPMESVRMTAISNIKISAQEKNRKLTPISLGIMNFKREPKKVWSIVISLSLGGIILLTVSSALLLQSPVKMTQHYFGDADYKIYIKSDKEPTELLYSGNPLNDNLKEEIGSIPGINEMQTLRKSATFTFEYKGYGGRGMCDMITTQNKKEIEDSLVAGRMPENSHEILVKTGYEDFGEEVKVGMQFEISFGKEKIPVTVSGIFQSTKFASALGSGRGGFNAAMMCMTEDAFKELLPGIKNFDFTWGINIDPKEQSSVDENLRNTISKNEDIAIESFSERVKGYEKDNTIYFVLQVISILIFLFGVINLINTTLSNQLFRRREYSVLRSIGLTEKQLYKVIIGEGMCYSILSICMTLLIGTPIAMLICRQMSISCYGKVVEYSFPFFYMGIYVLVLLLIQVILSIYQIREQKKKSIIDQLRME